MLILSCSPIRLKTNSALHFIHPKDKNSNDVKRIVTNFSTSEKQIYRVGEHILTKNRFDHFETYVIHASTPEYQIDFLKKLKKDNLPERLSSAIVDRRKQVVVFGNSIQLLPDKTTIIKRDTRPIASSIISMLTDDFQSPGLGILKYRVDINFNPKLLRTSYGKKLEFLSIKEPIILLDSVVVFHSLLGCKFGNVYLLYKKRLKLIRKFPGIINHAEQSIVGERRIASIKAIYSPETEKERAEVKLGDSEELSSK